MHLTPGLKAADYGNHLGQIREYPLPLSHWRCFQTKEGLAHQHPIIKAKQGAAYQHKTTVGGEGGNWEAILIKEQKSLLGTQ